MMDVLTLPVIFILIFLIVAIAVLLGHASTKVVFKITEKLFGIETKTIADGPLERLFTYSALGFAFIIIYGVLLSVFTLFSQLGALLIIGLSIIVELIILARRKSGERILEIMRTSNERLKNFLRKPGQIFLIALFVIAVFWYFYPAIGSANYPGGDDKAYIFVTKSIIDQRTALAPIEYPYAQPYMNHLLQGGFMVVASFFYNLLQLLGLPTSIPIVHLSLTLLYLSLIPISMYLLTIGLTRNREFSTLVALATLFIWNAIPLYVYWGGVGEALGYFLVPVLVLFDYRLNVTLMRNTFRLRTFAGATVVKCALAAIVLYVQIYSLFLFTILVIVATPLWAMRNHLLYKAGSLRDKTKVYLKIILPYAIFLFGGIIILVGAMTLMQSTGNKNTAIEVLYGILVSSPEDIKINSAQLLYTAPSLIFRDGYGLVYSAYALASNISYFLNYWGFGLVLLYLFFVLYLTLPKNRVKTFNGDGMRALGLTNLMVVTAAVFFIFSQNSPLGWYYIPYPMALLVYTDRLYYEMSLIMIYVESLPLYLMYLFIRKELLNSSQKIKKRSNSGLALNIRKHVKPKKAVAIAIMIVVIASVTLPAIISNYSGYASDTGISVVTKDDLDAFAWIEANTAKNATFFVNDYDAGAFVYVFTGRIVLPPDAIRANDVNSSITIFDEAETTLQEGNITQQLIQVLRAYNVSYVYVGEKTQYYGPAFNTIALIQSPYFEIAFHQGGAYVFIISAP
jgi:hypothetical protein